MSKSKTPPASKPTDAVDWTGVRLQRVEYKRAETIFTQGDPATSVMYVEKGAVRLSVLSHAGKEAVVALLEAGHFLRRGLPGEPATTDGDGDGHGSGHHPGR